MSPELRRTTHFTEPSDELGDLENLQRLCVAHLFIVFSRWIHSAYKVQHSTASADWRATAHSQQAKFYELAMRLFLHCGSPCSPMPLPGFTSDFWKRAHWLENWVDSYRESRSKFQQRQVGRTNLRKASGSPWGGSCCRYDCSKCTAIAYLLTCLPVQISCRSADWLHVFNICKY